MRTVGVRLTADISGLTTALSRGGAAVDRFADQTKQSADRGLSAIEKNSAAYDRVGTGLVTAGAVGTAALVGLGKAAIDWESQWAGVMKTVDGTQGQYAALESELRGLATSLPATHEEIAAVAEAAGQLGIRREDISSFTKTMIDLGETTNLTADEAATAIAQMANVMGTSTDDIDNLGSTLVALGNSGASTEKDILSMASRIAGAGAQIGLSEGEVLAFASSLASVGIEAEAGGTAISTSFVRIDKAVREGGESLELLANTAGLTSDEFAAAYRDNAAGAVNQFVVGLGEAQKAGGDTNAILEELGITGIREADALRRLASSGTILGENLDLQGKAWEENSALATEAQARYETSASKIQVSWNKIKDAAITAGGVLLPMVAGIAEGVGTLAEAFASLPAPVQQGLVAVVGIGSAGALAAGGMLKLAVGLAEGRSALKDIATSSPGAAKGLKAVSAAAGPLAFGAVAFAALGVIQSGMLKIPDSAAQAAAALDELGASAGRNGALLDEFFTMGDGGFSADIKGIDEAIQALTLNDDPLANLGSTFAGTFGIKDELALSREQFAKLDEQLATMDAAEAQAAFAQLEQKMLAAGLTTQEIADIFPQYAERARTAASASGEMSESTGSMTSAIDQSALAAASAAEALAEQEAAIRNASDAAIAASNSMIAYEQSIDDATAAAEKNGATLDLNTEAGRDNQSALNSMAAAAKVVTDATRVNGQATAETTAAQKRAADQFIATGQKMGLTAQEARDLAIQYGLIPGEVSTSILAPGAQGTKAQAEAVTKAMKDIPESEQTAIRSAWEKGGYEAAMAAIRNIPKNTTTTITTKRLTIYETRGSAPAVGGPRAFANAYGGLIPGSSPHPRADDKLSWLTSGEFVQDVPATRYAGVDAMQRILSRQYDPSALRAALGLSGRGYAYGGEVDRATQYVPAPVSYATRTVVESSAPVDYDRIGRIQERATANGVRRGMHGVGLGGGITLTAAEAI